LCDGCCLKEEKEEEEEERLPVMQKTLHTCPRAQKRGVMIFLLMTIFPALPPDCVVVMVTKDVMVVMVTKDVTSPMRPRTSCTPSPRPNH
jgi:hypothetical protein